MFKQIHSLQDYLLANAIATSGRATDEQLAELQRLNVDAFRVDEEIKRRAKESDKRSNP